MAELELRKMERSPLALALLGQLRFTPGNDKILCEGGRGFFMDNMNALLGAPGTLFYFAFEDGAFRGVIYGLPKHWHSYECHHLYLPGRENRRHVLDFGTMALERFWMDTHKTIRFVFGYTPTANRPAMWVARRMGFTEIGRIPNYAVIEGKPADVAIFLKERE